MNKDYLTSPFNDVYREKFSSTISAIRDSIITHNNFEKILDSIEVIQDAYRKTTISSIANALNIIKDIPIYRPSENMVRILKDITITLNEKGFLDTEEDIELVIKESKIYSEDNENKETADPIIDGRNLDSWKQYQDNKYLLDFAFFNYKLALQKFNEAFHKGYSYVSERKVAVWGLSNAIIILITTLASVNSMLPFYLFSVISFAGLFTPKDK